MIQINVGAHIAGGSGHGRAMFLAGGGISDSTYAISEIARANSGSMTISAATVNNGYVQFTIANPTGSNATAVISVITDGINGALPTVAVS